MATENTTAPVVKTKQQVQYWLYVSEAILVVLLVLSAIGVGITDFSPQHSWKFRFGRYSVTESLGAVL